MEITLEKIELIKDRTGVTYKEAKEALEKASGEVVEAIILLENEVNNQNDEETFISLVISKVKEFVNKGNITKIIIKKDGEPLVNVPLNAGIIGAVVTPFGVIALTLAAFGFKCQIELQTVEGNIINITDKVKDAYNTLQEKGEVVLDYAKDKAPVVVDFAKEKSEIAWNFAKEKGSDIIESAKDKIGETKDKMKTIDTIEEIDVDSNIISTEINGEE